MRLTGTITCFTWAFLIVFAQVAGASPYAPSSPWNTPIERDPSLDARSGAYMQAIADNGLPLTSDRDQYAITVYEVDENTPKATVKLTGYFSSYDRDDRSRVGAGTSPTVADIPIPNDAQGGQGSDGQIVLLDARRGIEWGFWQFR